MNIYLRVSEAADRDRVGSRAKRAGVFSSYSITVFFFHLSRAVFLASILEKLCDKIKEHVHARCVRTGEPAEEIASNCRYSFGRMKNGPSLQTIVNIG